MKKILIILILVTIMCGCSIGDKKYDNFKHYDLTNYNHKEFLYTRDDSGAWYDIETEKYAVAVLVEDYEKAEGYEEGVLYEVSEDDYILLDSFMGCDTCYNSTYYTYVYNDKLYMVRNMGAAIFEYTLNRENTEKKELKFNYDLILDNYKELNLDYVYVFGHKIDKVDNEFIYFRGVLIDKVDSSSLNIKCSLVDYKCEEYKQ